MTTILLTGAAGVLGRALIDELAADHEVVCLRRRAAVDDRRVTEYAGDLTADRLGLGAADHDRLAGTVDVVLHAAAATSWTLSPEEIAATNVGGTERMLAFAERAGAPLYYVSTAFVGRPLPSGTDHRFTGPRAYVESKIAAERLVTEHPAGAAVLRPSIVVGDSRTGAMSAFQGIHKAIRAAVRGTAPMIPADARSLVDVVPQDIAARATGELIRRRATGEYWLTAGPGALTVEEMLEACRRVAKLAGLSPTRPRLVPTEMVDRLLLPLMDDVIPRAMRRRFDDLVTLMLLFQAPVALPTSLPELGFGAAVGKEALLDSFERGVEYWAASCGLLTRAVAA